MTRKRTTENDLLASAASAPARRTPAARTRSRRTASPVEAKPAPAVEPAAPAPEAVAAPVVLEPSYEEIARLAYSHWEARGCVSGSPDEDWLRAEQELRTRATSVTA